MNKTTEEKQEFVTRLFENKTLFEKEVLRAESESDRAEIMKILAVSLVRETLREELNFLYIKNFSDFSLIPIKNILFKEVANEWLHYALDVLHLTRQEALQVIQEKVRIQFILSIVHSYLQKYKSYIFEEVADTFIELVSTIPHAKTGSLLIEEVFNSSLILNEKLLSVHNFEQLWRRVKAANNSKNVDVNRIKMKINEISTSLCEKNLDIEKKESHIKLLEQYKLKLEKINSATLEKFDGALKRVKESMVNSMSSMNL
jgi:hypothetical protein